MKIFIFCILIFYLNIYAGCRKGGITCKQTVYSFEGFYKAYPDLDSIHINDTVWLELSMPTQSKDLSSNQTVDYSGAENLGTVITYLELVKGTDDPPPNSAANSFENVLVKGSSIQSLNPDKLREFLFREDVGLYVFKLGIVPKKKGLFVIAPSDAAGVYTRTNKCAKASFSLTFKDTNQHLYLYRQSRPGYEPSGYEQSHGYYFKVY